MSIERDIKDNLMFLCSFPVYSAPSYLKGYFGFEFAFLLSCFVLISSIVPALILFPSRCHYDCVAGHCAALSLLQVIIHTRQSTTAASFGPTLPRVHLSSLAPSF